MAVDNQWAFDLETKIFSVVNEKAMGKIRKNYPSAYITRTGKSTAKAIFPTIYIHELPGAETGKDLEGFYINGVRETIQVDVTTNTSQGDARKIMAIVADEFKQMRFAIAQMPEIGYSGETFRSTARFSRVIGSNDTL